MLIEKMLMGMGGFLIVGLIGLGGALLMLFAGGQPTIDPDPHSPGHYGLPTIVGGYRILAVQSAETLPCAPPDFLNVIFQLNESDMQAYLKSPGEHLSFQDAVEAIRSDVFTYTFVGPEHTTEEARAFFAKTEADLNGVCWTAPNILEIGIAGVTSPDGTMTFFTPTPIPLPSNLDSYLPAHYGLPETLAGYRILIVESIENRPCMPPDFRNIIVQISELDMQAYLNSTTTPQSLHEAIMELDPSGNTSFGVVGSGQSYETWMANYAELDAKLQGHGCPIPVRIDLIGINTPTPIPEGAGE